MYSPWSRFSLASHPRSLCFDWFPQGPVTIRLSPTTMKLLLVTMRVRPVTMRLRPATMKLGPVTMRLGPVTMRMRLVAVRVALAQTHWAGKISFRSGFDIHSFSPRSSFLGHVFLLTGFFGKSMKIRGKHYRNVTWWPFQEARIPIMLWFMCPLIFLFLWWRESRGKRFSDFRRVWNTRKTR